MWIRKYLDDWDERQAEEDSPHKPVEKITIGAELVFADADRNASLDDFAQLVQQQRANTALFYSGADGFAYDFKLDGEILTFRSAIATEVANNNVVHARVAETSKRRSAVVILPHWNASLWSYRRFSSYLSHLGFGAVELTLPYHGSRNRSDGKISDYFLSANLGRTIQSVRQAVIDTRAVLDWLYQRGYERVGLIGVSLGSCVAGLVAAHDARVHCSALLLTAGDFAEVVWTGRATRHIRLALEPAMELRQLDAIWSIISTGSFAREMSRNGHRTLLISGDRDTVVKPYLTRRLVDQMRSFDARLDWTTLGCGHYSIARFPFNAWAFGRLVMFLKEAGLRG